MQLLGGLGGGGVSAPDFQNVDLTPGEKSSGAAIAGNFANRGLGTSTMETQAENANVLDWSTRQAEQNMKTAQTAFNDQLQADQSNTGSLSGLAELAGFFG